MQFTIQGSTIIARPVIEGSVSTDIYVEWALDVFTERAKVTQTASGGSLGTNYTHITPTPPFLPYLQPYTDPLEPHVPNRDCSGRTLPCGPILSYIWTSELDCWDQRETIEYHGHSRESVIVHFSHPDHPEFKFTAMHHLLDSDLEVPIESSGVPTFEHYVKDALKLAYVWENFPWIGDDNIAFFGPMYNNGSVMDFWSNLTAIVPYDCNATVGTDTYRRNITVVGNNIPFKTFVEISTVYIADGYSWAETFAQMINADFRFENGASIKTQIRSSINDGPIGHWNKAHYDPNFGNLVAPPIEEEPSLTPQKKVGKLAGWAVALIAIASVAAFVVAIVLVVSFVPAANKLIRPFAHRDTNTTTSTRTSSSSGWTRANKPENA